LTHLGYGILFGGFLYVLKETKPLAYNITRKNTMVLESLKDNKEIRIYKLTKEIAQ
jgi:hypothetical protein